MNYEALKNVNVWQVDVRPFLATEKDPAKFCFEKGIVAIGWSVPGKPLSKEEYWEMGKGIYAKDNQWVRAATPFLFQMKENDLVWLKDFEGFYYLGRIEGEWHYRDEPEFLQVGLPNARKCKLFKVGSDAPGSIEHGFRTGSIVQKINDFSAHLFSRISYNRLSGEEFYTVEEDFLEKTDVFGLLTNSELEDVVALFLQRDGYYVIPSTFNTEENYNFQMVHQSTGEKAFVRISSNGMLDPNMFSDFPHKVFLFSPVGYRSLEAPLSHVVALKKEDMENFFKTHENLMPYSIRVYLEWKRAKQKIKMYKLAGKV
ncbi:hypothetical protein AN618_04660 [Fervidicola ferrireducens]|uniref:Uncharacterized protein n=1 Tax=Fervidicola ferrireducens TaxID=520764 RepID=A0A140LCX5_9FIRM|nr:hypothetical protein [Fervidicola ferrireducens]KXG78400.1 hypothetical protein AN618_04660 [Fervidicola ferrireducens]